MGIISEINLFTCTHMYIYTHTWTYFSFNHMHTHLHAHILLVLFPGEPWLTPIVHLCAISPASFPTSVFPTETTLGTIFLGLIFLNQGWWVFFFFSGAQCPNLAVILLHFFTCFRIPFSFLKAVSQKPYCI